MSCPNMAVVAIQYNYIHKTKVNWFVFIITAIHKEMFS